MNLLTLVLTMYVASRFLYRTCRNTRTVIEGFEVVTVDTEDFCPSECDAYGLLLHGRRT